MYLLVISLTDTMRYFFSGMGKLYKTLAENSVPYSKVMMGINSMSIDEPF